MAFGGFAGIAEGEQRLGFVNGGMRVAYVLGSPQLYWKPMLDINLATLQLGGFTESGRQRRRAHHRRRRARPSLR